MKKIIIFLFVPFFPFFAFSQEEVPRAVVSVIVDGANLNHVRAVVGEAKALSRKVLIRNLLMIQKMPDVSDMAQDNKKINPEAQARLQAGMQQMQATMAEVRVLDLEKSEGKSDLSLLDKLRITNSPTWIVRYKGRNHIYEGYPSIDRYFSANGDFKEGD